MSTALLTPTGRCSTCSGKGCGKCNDTGTCPGCRGTGWNDEEHSACWQCNVPEEEPQPAWSPIKPITRNGTHPTATPTTEPPPVVALEFVTAKQLAYEIDNTPPTGFLCRPVWPADAYGVIAAEKKAGKTWVALDLAVSVASATPWLDVYPVERSGPVLLFLGEGGKRKMLRRLRAIGEFKGLAVEQLPIEFCFRVPHLTNLLHMAHIDNKIEQQHPALVIVDPLYLAARGAKGASLYDMGEALEAVQNVAQRHNAALVIVHHWNQTGTGKGADRMSGAGPAEWGRVLVSASVEHRRTDPDTKASTVTLGVEFTGDEIPDTDLRIRRRVWTDNPDDLAAPMHYEIELLEGRTPGAANDSMKPATRRVYDVLTAAAGLLTVTQIGDVLANDNTGMPLRVRTIQDALKDLETLGHAHIDHIEGRTAFWRAHPLRIGAENAV